MKYQQLSLFDLFPEEEKTNEQEIEEYKNSLNTPLEKMTYDLFIGWWELRKGLQAVKDVVSSVVKSKTYHYGNMEKGMYIFSIQEDEKKVMIFDNGTHYLACECIDDIEQVLFNNEFICFPAMYCKVYDRQGNIIHQYGTRNDDIRYIACISEWKMNQFSFNRIEEKKPVKDFYEIKFKFKDLVNYWGECV